MYAVPLEERRSSSLNPRGRAETLSHYAFGILFGRLAASSFFSRAFLFATVWFTLRPRPALLVGCFVNLFAHALFPSASGIYGACSGSKECGVGSASSALHAVSAAHRCPAALVLAKCCPAAWTSIASAHPEEIARLTDPAPADVPRMPSPRAVLRASSTTARLYGAVRLR